MKVKDLKQLLEKLDDNDSILGQVVAENGGAWNMEVRFYMHNRGLFVRMSHPELKELPEFPEDD